MGTVEKWGYAPLLRRHCVFFAYTCINIISVYTVHIDMLCLYSPGGATDLDTKACGLLSDGPILHGVRHHEVKRSIYSTAVYSLLLSHMFSQPHAT